MPSIPIRPFLSIFSNCGLVVILLASSAAATSNATADSNIFYSLVQAAQHWQDAHPNECGRDTTTCGVQKLISGFQTCSGLRIVNGCPISNANIYGCQVGVFIAKNGDTCSGTLVSPTHVVCAAHCSINLTASDASQILVYTGNQVKNATAIIRAARFAVNPGFNSKLITNDASIIELSRQFTFGRNGIRPACLPTGPVRRPLYPLIVGGYGTDNFVNTTGIGILRYTILPVTPDYICSYYYGPLQYGVKLYGPCYKHQFCAYGQRAEDGTGSCFGDSGSGVMSRSSSGVWRLIGIVSYGPKKCGTIPSVYSDAFNCGIKASPAAIKFTQQNKSPSKQCPNFTR